MEAKFLTVEGGGGASAKEPACQCRRPKRLWFNHWVRKIPWRRKWQLTPVFLPGESCGQRNLAGYSPWGLKRVGHNLVTKQQQMYGSSPLLGTGDLSVNNTSVIMKFMV